MADSEIYGLGDKLKKLRETYNLTQQEVADRVKVDRNSISRYENDNLIPKVETLIQFAIIYNTSLDYLLGLGKENYLNLNRFTDCQRKIILQTVEGMKNFNYEDTKTGS